MASNEKIDQFYKDAVNKMLEPHGVDFDYVLKNQKITGIEWFQYYTWTKSDREEYQKWFVAEMRKRLRIPKYRAEKEFASFNLMWGLKEIG